MTEFMQLWLLLASALVVGLGVVLLLFGGGMALIIHCGERWGWPDWLQYAVFISYAVALMATALTVLILI